MIIIKVEPSKKWNRMRNNFPKFYDKLGLKISEKFAGGIRQEVVRQKLIWTGKLHKSIIAKIIKKGISVVSAVNYASALDSAPMHYISLKPGRKITAWCKDYGMGYDVIKKRFAIKGLWVHPHPFINNGLINGYKNVSPTIKSEFNNFMITRGGAK